MGNEGYIFDTKEKEIVSIHYKDKGYALEQMNRLAALNQDPDRYQLQHPEHKETPTEM